MEKACTKFHKNYVNTSLKFVQKMVLFKNLLTNHVSMV